MGGPTHGPAAAPLLLCWLWGGQLLTPEQEQEGVSDGSPPLSPLSQHPTTHPSTAQLFFSARFICAGAQPKKAREESAADGEVHSTFIVWFRP